MLERLFKLSERGATVSGEVVGGLTTFLAMAYIVVVNPQILTAAGVTFQAALTATCLGAALMTILMGIIANKPIALASGMGINAIVAYTLSPQVDWRVAMAVVFCEGLIILVLVLCGLRKAIMDAIPVDLRRAIGIGIGLFIAFIGLKGGGVIASDASTFIAIGELSSPTCIVAIVSIVLAVILQAAKVRGGLILSIIGACLVGVPLGVTQAPTSWDFGLDFSTMFAPFQTDPNTGTVAIAQVVLQPALLLMVFSLLMSDFFDTMGTVMAVGERADFVDKEGNVEDIQPILIVDSAAAAVGGLTGASSITSFVESTSGAAAGARTGLANIVTGVLFFLCAFFSPLVGMVSSAATCGALVVVGYLMMTDVADIDWTRIEHAFPAFITIIGIPFTYSITNGIGFGFISYCIIMIFQGKVREIKPLMWVAAAAFLIMFIMQ